MAVDGLLMNNIVTILQVRRIRERLALAMPASPPPASSTCPNTAASDSAATTSAPSSAPAAAAANTAVCTVDPLAPASGVDEAGALARLRALRDVTRGPRPKDDPTLPRAQRLNNVLKAICRALKDVKGMSMKLCKLLAIFPISPYRNMVNLICNLNNQIYTFRKPS